MSPAPILIVGIGSPHGDDQAGWRVAERLASDLPLGVEVRAARSPSELLDWLDGVEQLILSDACRGEERTGTIRCWTWPDAAIQRVRWSGTHDLGLCAVLELAEALGRLPPRVTIWSIGAVRVDPCAPMSTEVDAAIEDVVRKIRRQIIA